MRILQADIFKNHANLVFGFSTRIGGVSPASLGMNLSFNVGDDPENVARNRELFLGSLGIQQEEVAFTGQIHSATVLRAEKPGTYADCDGLVTDHLRLFLAITTADCVPVFLFDARHHVVAAVHAGWRGTECEISAHAVQVLRKEFGTDPSELLAFVGPAADVCCYEIGNDVAEKFEDQFIRREAGRLFLDLKSANARQLLRSGIPWAHIDVSPHCTITESDVFHSYRRERERSGRMIGVIGLTEAP